MNTLSQRQPMTKIKFLPENCPSEEQVFLMRALSGEITFRNNQEVLNDLKKRLKLKD